MAEEMNRKDAAQEKLTDRNYVYVRYENCLLYTSDAADERSSVDLGGRGIIKKKTTITINTQHNW